MTVKDDLINTITAKLIAALPDLPDAQKTELTTALVTTLNDFAAGIGATIIEHRQVQANLDAADRRVKRLQRQLSAAGTGTEQVALLTATVTALADTLDTEGNTDVAERVRQSVILAQGMSELPAEEVTTAAVTESRATA